MKKSQFPTFTSIPAKSGMPSYYERHWFAASIQDAIANFQFISQSVPYFETKVKWIDFQRFWSTFQHQLHSIRGVLIRKELSGTGKAVFLHSKYSFIHSIEIFRPTTKHRENGRSAS